MEMRSLLPPPIRRVVGLGRNKALVVLFQPFEHDFRRGLVVVHVPVPLEPACRPLSVHEAFSPGALAVIESSQQRMRAYEHLGPAPLPRAAVKRFLLLRFMVLHWFRGFREAFR